MNDTTNTQATEVEDPLQSLDLGSLMDMNLDGIEYAPDFINPPAGDYSLTVTKMEAEAYESKPDDAGNTNKGNRIRLTLAVASTLQLADAKEQPVPDGSLFSLTWQVTTQGMEFFKTFARNALGVEDLEGATLGSIKTALVGSTFDARISVKKTAKKDTAGKVVAGEFFENINVRPIVLAAE